MSRVRPYRQRWLLGPAVAISAIVQVGAVAAYQLLKPVPPPPPVRLTVVVDGAGEGTVLVSTIAQHDARGQLAAPPMLLGRCASGATCGFDVPVDRAVSLTAVRGDKMTFEGWNGCVGYAEDVLTCEVAMFRERDVFARFGKMPEEMEVAWVEPSAELEVTLPKLPPPPPPPIEAEKLEEDKVAMAVPPPPPPDVPKPIPNTPPPPPPEDKPPPKPVQPPPSNMRMVEVPDENEVKEAPDDATHLSDKNRDVAEESAAKETNLEKQLDGKTAPSQESPDTTSPEVGGPEDKIAQLEHAESELDDRERDSDHSGESETAKGQIIGEAGEGGDNGEGGDPNPGLLAMRGVGGRGSVLEQVKKGDGKKVGPKGIPGLNAPLEMDDYERIIGKEKSDRENVLAKARLSGKKGRWERKLEAIKSSLENFTPDVRTGNQTALKTRASPFAVYIARMHRRIHELWGFGFLAQLDGESSSHPLNNFDLYTVIEASLNPDGTVHKTTITHASGRLEFDVAAIDTILSAAPYEETPEVIRSADGRVYLRWGFYRNWRQCGTFNVEPYILDNIPNAEPLDDGMALKNARPKRGQAPVTPSADATAPAPGKVSGDKQASYAANMWVAGLTSGSTERMMRVSALPFRAGGAVAAESAADLKEVYAGIIVESGTLKGFEVVSTGDFTNKTGVAVPGDAGTLVVLVRASKATFGVILTPTRSGEYRATGIAR